MTKLKRLRLERLTKSMGKDAVTLLAILTLDPERYEPDDLVAAVVLVLSRMDDTAAKMTSVVD